MLLGIEAFSQNFISCLNSPEVLSEVQHASAPFSIDKFGLGMHLAGSIVKICPKPLHSLHAPAG
jgi:hypothetical protein